MQTNSSDKMFDSTENVNEEKNKILLSFIIPVFNVEKYLDECLNSIVNQNIDKCKYEIICVNDGSTDSSLKILKKYEKTYPNIKIIDKENGGVSSARNEGLKNANGKWIWFVDSDDYIIKDCCSYLLKKAEHYEPDIVVFSGKIVQEYREEDFVPNDADITSCHGRENVLSLCPKRSYANGPVYYLFLKNKVYENCLQFDESMKYGEDTKFIFEYKFNCCSGLLVDICLYFYRQNPSSAMHSMNGEAHATSMYKLAETYDSYMIKCEDNKELYNRLKIARSRAARNFLFDYYMYIRNYERAKKALAEIRHRGWHPYKVKMGIYSKSLKGILINLFNSLLSVKWIYLLACKIRSKKK